MLSVVWSGPVFDSQQPANACALQCRVVRAGARSFAGCDKSFDSINQRGGLGSTVELDAGTLTQKRLNRFDVVRDLPLFFRTTAVRV